MKKNLSLLLLMCAGIGIGVGISEISKQLHTQDFIPNQYSPNAQDSQNLGENVQNLTQDSIDLNKSQSLELPENATSLAQDDSLNTPQTENPDTLFAPQDSRDSTMVIVQDIFSQERQIPQFQEYPTNIYQGQFMSADESCVNCQGGPQEALKRGIIDFGGKYALYRLKPNNDEIIIGAVNVENGEVLEFPTIYKEVAPPFDLSILSKPSSTLVWIKGVDVKNPDVYKIEAYELKGGNLKKVQGFEIHFIIPENLDLQSTTATSETPATPAQEPTQDNTQEVSF